MGEIFTTTPQKKQVSLSFNGGAAALVDAEGSVRDFAVKHATSMGIRTFSLYLDGDKADTDMGGDLIDSYNTVEIVTKDARGVR